MSPEEISNEVEIPLETIKRVESMLRRSEHKRIGQAYSNWDLERLALIGEFLFCQKKET